MTWNATSVRRPLSGSIRQRIYKDGTSKDVRKRIPEWRCHDQPNAIVNALETETLKEDADLK